MEREYICHTYCQDYLKSKEFTKGYLFGLILARSLRLGYSAMHNLHKLLQKLSKLSDLSRTTFQDSQISQPIVHFRPFPGSIRVGGQKTVCFCHFSSLWLRHAHHRAVWCLASEPNFGGWVFFTTSCFFSWTWKTTYFTTEIIFTTLGSSQLFPYVPSQFTEDKTNSGQPDARLALAWRVAFKKASSLLFKSASRLSKFHLCEISLKPTLVAYIQADIYILFL